MKKLMMIGIAILAMGIVNMAHGAAAYWRDTYVRWCISGVEDSAYVQLCCYDYDTGDILWAGQKVTAAVANRGDSGLVDFSGHTEPLTGYMAGNDYFRVLIYDANGSAVVGQSVKVATYGFLAQVQSIYAIPGAEPYDFGIPTATTGGGGFGNIPEPTSALLMLVASALLALSRKEAAK